MLRNLNFIFSSLKIYFYNFYLHEQVFWYIHKGKGLISGKDQENREEIVNSEAKGEKQRKLLWGGAGIRSAKMLSRLGGYL